MRRINTSHAALAIAGAALFVALGGPAWAKGVLVGTHQLRNSAVTSRKIAKGAVHNTDLAKAAVRGANIKKGTITVGRLAANAVNASKIAANAVGTAKIADAAVTSGKLADASVTTGKLADQSVTNGKLADNAVTSGKVQDASLTATDVAPNTFLAANGTARDSLAVGGVPAAGFAHLASTQTTVAQNGAQKTLFSIPTGFVRVSCPVNHPAVTYDNASTAVEYGEEDNNGVTTHFTTVNNGLANSGDTVTSTTGLLRVTAQVASRSDARASTIMTTAHVEGVVCHFTSQAFSTG